MKTSHRLRNKVAAAAKTDKAALVKKLTAFARENGEDTPAGRLARRITNRIGGA